MELSVALPAYLEAENLRVLLPTLKKVTMELAASAEVIVVDTTTPRDETPEICAATGAQYFPRTGGETYGDAIRTSINSTSGKWVVLMDADGSHNPEVIRELWDHRLHADIVIASRYVSGGRTENPKILIFMSQVVNVIFRIFLNLKCYDVSNSFRLYRGDELRALQLECNNFDVVEEILVKLAAARPDLRIKEVPFTFEKRKAGETKRQLFAFMIGYIGTLVKLMRLKARVRRQATDRS